MGYFVVIVAGLLAVLIVFCAIYFWQKKPDALVNDPTPMTLLLRRVVLIYLMLLGGLLVALLIDLNMVNFPETAVTVDLKPLPPSPTPIPTPTSTQKPGSQESSTSGPGGTQSTTQTPTAQPGQNAAGGSTGAAGAGPSTAAGASPTPKAPSSTSTQNTSRKATKTPAGKTTQNATKEGDKSGVSAGQSTTTAAEPKILQIIPRSTSGVAPTVYLAVYGENFIKDKSLVRFNGDVRPTAYIGTGTTLLEAQPETANIAGQGTITVDVVTDGKPSNAIVVAIERPVAELNLGVSHPLISREVQLLLIVLAAGALGCLLHALRSIADFVGSRKAISSWFWWYITRPLLGMALALIFYSVLRGGFLAGTPADAKAISPFGVLAMGALVGMFTDKATEKLAEIFDVLVKVDPSKRTDPLKPDALSIKTDKFTGNKLPAGAINAVYTPVTMEAVGGTPPYTWSQTGLPAGISLGPDGKISGTPTVQVNNQQVTIKVTDKSNQSATATLSITIA